MGPHGFDEATLRRFGALVIRLQQGQDLTRDEARDAYLEIWRAEQPDLQQGALIAAHRIKGASIDELVGMAESHDIVWREAFPFVIEGATPHLGIVGVGTDTLKTFNVSSAASLVIAACGVLVHKVGGPGMTGVSGSHDAFFDWGVDPFAPLGNAIEAVSKVGIGFSTPMTPHLGALGIGRVLSQIRFATVIHMMGPIGNHSGEKHKIVGVPSPEYCERIGGAMHQLGYERALVPCGAADDTPGKFMDEFSNCGPTKVASVTPAGVEIQTLVPGDFGVETVPFASVAAAKTRAENVRDGVRVLAGDASEAKIDLLAMNAGAALHMMGHGETWADATEHARAAIRSGAALDKLRALINAQNVDPKSGMAKLDALLG